MLLLGYVNSSDRNIWVCVCVDLGVQFSRSRIKVSCSHFYLFEELPVVPRQQQYLSYLPAIAEGAFHLCCYRLIMSFYLSRTLQVNVGAGSHPNKVKVYGPGVAKTGLKAHEPTYFTVDCTEAGQGKT